MTLPFSVTQTVDAHLARTASVREADGLWHPSSLFSCERQAVYEVRGTPASDERSDRSRRILRLGTSMHEIVQRAMVEDARAVAIYNEVAVDIPALSITGHCDTLLQFSDDEYELLEFKSISPKGMNYGDLPKKEHESQARTYAYGLRHVGGRVADAADLPDFPPLGDKLQRIRIAYFNRDDLEIREFVLPVDEEWERDLEAKIARLNRYTDGLSLDGLDDLLPPRLPLERGKKNWLCGYCQFRTKCWVEDREGVDL